ncbi:hypothetical protein ABN154_26565 [Klebsiella michiganensis]|uniref:hypothetical protein n=1 Tax=Klebsiella michiganensis TaxID=1134687 RepID=UPI0032D9FC35
MSPIFNEYNQPVGESLPEWNNAFYPSAKTLNGRFSSLEALHDRHILPLAQAYDLAGDDRDWTYFAQQMPRSLQEYQEWIY